MCVRLLFFIGHRSFIVSYFYRQKGCTEQCNVFAECEREKRFSNSFYTFAMEWEIVKQKVARFILVVVVVFLVVFLFGHKTAFHSLCYSCASRFSTRLTHYLGSI